MLFPMTRFIARAIARLALVPLALVAAGPALGGQGTPAEAPHPVVCGESVATLFSDFVTMSQPSTGINLDKPVVMLIDNRIPGATVPDPGPGPNNWPAASFSNLSAAPTQRWTARNLGQVYGVTFDNASPPNIYVTATTTFGSDNAAYDNGLTSPFASSQFPSGATGGEIYKLSGTNANITVFATLPNVGAGGGTGPGLGNICFDSTTQRFYVSNFHDGRIYSLDTAGNCKGTFKFSSGAITTNGTGPCPGDTTATPGFARLGERPWAVKTHNGRLFFSIWTEDRGRPNPTADNTIHSIGLTPSGDFTGVSQLELTVPLFQADWSNPVSDICFSSVGRMMLAERVMLNDVGIGAQFATGLEGHTARNIEFELIASVWTATAPARQFLLGNSVQAGNNSEGGIDYDCDDNLWSTIDQFPAGTVAVYGLQRTPESGNTLATIGTVGYFIDLDGISTVQSKNRIGDVAMYRCCCMEVATETLECDLQGHGNAHTWTFCITNNSGQTANALSILTPTGVTLSNQAFAINPPLLNGQTRCFTLTATGLPQGVESCFTFILRRTAVGAPPTECCRSQVCITPPVCCVDVTQVSLNPTPTGWRYCFTLTNLSGFNFHHLFIVDDNPDAPPVYSPQYFAISPPIQPGTTATGTFCVDITGALPGSTICFDIEVHDADLVDCCYEYVCLTIPGACPCPNPCPAGVESEQEPCGQFVNDNCTLAPPPGSFISPGGTWCGTAWADNYAHDIDWWYFSATAGQTYTVHIAAQFPFDAMVVAIDPVVGCPGTVVASIHGDACTDVFSLQFTAQTAGRYAIVINDQRFLGNPCGACNGYTLSISSPATCTGDINGDGVVGLADIAMVVQHWGEAGPVGNSRGGTVGLIDVADVIISWGHTCTP